jgi:hypothetical protein
MKSAAMKRLYSALAGSAAIAAAWFVYTLGVAFGFWQPVRRPSGVPATARYVSLIEDGTWFQCSVDAKRDLNFCRAWAQDGKLLANGYFRLQDEGRAATQSELRPSRVLRTNGRAYMIHLFGAKGAFSRALVPVDE